MKAVIRCDASHQIGTGHVVRCLALADMLAERGAEIIFIGREFPGHLGRLIESRGYESRLLPYEANMTAEFDANDYSTWLGISPETDAAQTLEILKEEENPDWLIIDHYAIDRRWEKRLRSRVGGIMLIDCLADRPHDCDILLDQNLYTNQENRHRNLVPENCRVLIGPQYALLRREFREARRTLRERDGRIGNILIQLGGVDKSNETTKALEAVIGLKRPDIKIEVVVGLNNSHRLEIEKRCDQFENITYHCQTSRVAQLMAAADLAIGAGGITTWERCFLGLPSLTVIVARNQETATGELHKLGATLNLGWYENVTPEIIREALKKVLDNPSLLKKMGQKALAIMGEGISDEPGELLKLLFEKTRV